MKYTALRSAVEAAERFIEEAKALMQLHDEAVTIEKPRRREVICVTPKRQSAVRRANLNLIAALHEFRRS